MIHKTTCRLVRLNQLISRVGITPYLLRVLPQRAPLGNNLQTRDFSPRTLAGELSGASHLLSELEEGGYAK